MSSSVSALSRNPDILIEMIAGSRAANGKLRAMLETLKRALYGALSEKRDADEPQLALGLADLPALPAEPERDTHNRRHQDVARTAHRLDDAALPFGRR